MAVNYDKKTDYQALINSSVAKGNYRDAALYEQQRNAKIQGEGLKYNTTNNYGAFLDYSPSDAVKGYEKQLKAANDSKPADWKGGTYAKAVDQAMNKILNREKFSYDLNGDALYQQYKDQYSALGKQAMMDTMGQAAALTGGYGNSYASTAGNQAYQAYLQQLNDVVPQLYGMARDQYNQEGADLQNQYAMLADRQNTEYGQYRDKVSDWQSNREYLTNMYNTERDLDYNRYANNYNNALSNAQWQKTYEEGLRQYNESIRQFNEQMAFEKQKYEDEKAAKSSSGGSGGGRSRGRSDGGGNNTSGAKDYYVDNKTGKVNNVENRSLSFSPDEGIFTWNGKNYNSVDKLVGAWNKTDLSDADEEVLRRKFKSQTGKDLSNYGY